MKLKLRGDKIIWMIVAFLAMVSVLVVYSSSSYLVRGAENSLGKTAIFFEQLRSVILGFGLLILCYILPLGFYRKMSVIIFGGCVLLLIMTYIPGIGDTKNDAVRGIKIFGKTIQVFEFAKVGIILFIAHVIERYETQIGTWKSFFLYLILPIAVICLLIMPNSFSSTLLIAIISLMTMFFMEVKMKYLLTTIAAGIVLIVALFFTYKGLQALGVGSDSKAMKLFNRFGTVEKRIKIRFTDDIDDTFDSTTLTAQELNKKKEDERQPLNAKIAISEGKIFGKGPGHSTQRFSLSMAFSDFVYASIIEEYGLIGGLLVMAAYLIFLFRCIAIAQQCNTPYSSAVVIGLSFMIVFQAFLHILVNVGILPVTGHTLPLVSHGGTAYAILSGAFGIILSVSRTLEKQKEEESAAIAAQQTETEQIINNELYEAEDNN